MQIGWALGRLTSAWTVRAADLDKTASSGNAPPPVHIDPVLGSLLVKVFPYSPNIPLLRAYVPIVIVIAAVAIGPQCYLAAASNATHHRA